VSLAPAPARVLILVLALKGVVPASADDAIPENLVVDLRIYEARSSRPDFQVMEKLGFFVATDGAGVSEQQWLATIARKIPDSFLTTLARETVEADRSGARFELSRRTRSFGLDLNLENFLGEGTFEAKARGDFSRSGEPLREFMRPIELRLGQTYVFASRDLEVSAGEYLSHFRDFDDADHRTELYQSLREYTIFLVLAVTPRLAGPGADSEIVDVELGDNVLPELESPLGARITGQVVLELTIDGGGAPVEVFVLRSSVPELNPRILGAASGWRFPEGAERKVRLTLDLSADPR
jgi:hypothetical protein